MWRSDWLEDKFKMLDRRNTERNKGKGATYMKRKVGGPSEAGAPEDAPDWAIIEDIDADN